MSIALVSLTVAAGRRSLRNWPLSDTRFSVAPELTAKLVLSALGQTEQAEAAAGHVDRCRSQVRHVGQAQVITVDVDRSRCEVIQTRNAEVIAADRERSALESGDLSSGESAAAIERQINPTHAGELAIQDRRTVGYCEIGQFQSRYWRALIS